jgi:HD-GYP domain-containing protein (c-di-GMP phosphodiesterase class II)
VPIDLFENIDIIFLFKPFQLEFKTIEINTLKINVRESSSKKEFEKIQLHPEQIKLYLITPQEYKKNKEIINVFVAHKENSKQVGFFLVEDPQNIPTIKSRKKLTFLNKNELVIAEVKFPYTQRELFEEIKKSLHYLLLKIKYKKQTSLEISRNAESKAMNDISRAMTSKSFVTEEFLNLFLNKSLEISSADAGFLFIKKEKNFILKSKITFSQKISLKKELFNEKNCLILKNLIKTMNKISWFHKNETPRELHEFQFKEKNYKIKSYCALPIYLPQGEFEGFLILLNKKSSQEKKLNNINDINNYVTAFLANDLNLLESLANQAGIALEHTKLVQDLKKVFESFTAASITAIESRDPSTKGHSERVALLTVGLAEAINKTKNGIYCALNFSKIQIEEIRYASLLHDFGKIGVREHVLQKEKKLFPHELERIQNRFESIQHKLSIHTLELYIQNLIARKKTPTADDFETCKKEISTISRELKKYWNTIQSLNEPTILSEEIFEQIAQIASAKIMVGEQTHSLLTPQEIELLSIKRGSLSNAERIEIENHVTHSYNFLIQIPWSFDLKNLPEIVYKHHERLDGSGYPQKLKSVNIPIQAKMMAITDVFDALVAQDRPYKKAVPYEKALNILEQEAKKGKLDSELLKIFIEAKIGELTFNAEPFINLNSVA